jgi:hypothetical protein
VSEQVADGSSASGFLARVREIAGFVAPTTVVTALLFYFGYVATRSRFEYFGVYLDLTDLSNQRMLLYGVEVVYVPAALAFLAVLVLLAVQGIVRWTVGAAERDAASLLVALAAALGGLLLVARALLGMLVPRIEEVEPVPGTTALALAAGPAALASAAWIAGTVARRRLDRGESPSAPVRLAAWSRSDQARRVRRGCLACVVGLAVAGLFWAANEFAWAYGAGRAYDDARKLTERPSVILETRHALTDPPIGIHETALGSDGTAQDAFGYRYDGMRLLLASGGRLFLVPERWTKESRTMVVAYDGEVRVQLVPAG